MIAVAFIRSGRNYPGSSCHAVTDPSDHETSYAQVVTTHSAV